MKEEANIKGRPADVLSPRYPTVRARRECDCPWCDPKTPRHAPHLLIDRFNYAALPTVTRIA